MMNKAKIVKILFGSAKAKVITGVVATTLVVAPVAGIGIHKYNVSKANKVTVTKEISYSGTEGKTAEELNKANGVTADGPKKEEQPKLEDAATDGKKPEAKVEDVKKDETKKETSKEVYKESTPKSSSSNSNSSNKSTSTSSKSSSTPSKPAPTPAPSKPTPAPAPKPEEKGKMTYGTYRGLPYGTDDTSDANMAKIKARLDKEVERRYEEYTYSKEHNPQFFKDGKPIVDFLIDDLRILRAAGYNL